MHNDSIWLSEMDSTSIQDLQIDDKMNYFTRNLKKKYSSILKEIPRNSFLNAKRMQP